MATKSFLCLLLACNTFSIFSFNVTWDIEDAIHMPSIVSSQLVCDLDEDTIYFLGGRANNINNAFTTTNAIYIFNKTNNSFHEIPTTLPGNGAYFASNYICNNRTIYMFGPGTNDNTAAGQLWIFNIDTQRITNIPFPTNTAQISLPCTAINEQNHLIYIIGGQTVDNSVSNQILQFNITSHSFLNSTDPPMPNKLYASMCYLLNNTNTNINGTKHANQAILYVIGGESVTGPSKNISQFNISASKWTPLQTTLRESRSFTRCIYYEKDNFLLVVGGGAAGANSDGLFSNTSDIFYVTNYSVLPAFGDPLPNKIEFNSVSMHDNKIFVWGGYGIVNETKRNLNKIFVFDLPSDSDKNVTWTTLALVSGACFGTFLCGGVSYLLCGRVAKNGDGNDLLVNYRKFQK